MRKRIPGGSSIGRLAASMAGLLLVLGTTTGAAQATSTAAQPFALQGEAAGLSPAQVSVLQAEVDTYLEELGGTQVALNEIDLDGEGTVLVALPGEAHPRDFTAGEPGATAADPCFDNGMYSGWFCAYERSGYQGSQINMYRCGEVRRIPYGSGGSWVNNQSRGTRAYMYDYYGTTIYTTPGAYSSDGNANWAPVHSMIPC